MPPLTNIDDILLNALWENKGVIALAVAIMIASSVLKLFASMINGRSASARRHRHGGRPKGRQRNSNNFRPEDRGWKGEQIARHILDRFGVEHLDDVYLPSMDGVTQIDHVAYVNGVILVVETKNYSGRIFGASYQEQWTQSFVGGGENYKFQNPLRQNYGHLKAVETVVGKAADLVGVVVFIGSSEFPQGFPEGVVDRLGLAAFMRTLRPKNGVETAKAWALLKRTVAKSNRVGLKNIHGLTIRRKTQ